MKPINYWIQLEPDLKSFIFKGTEVVSFELDEETSTIILDTADLKIQKVILESDKTNTATFEINKNKQQLTIKFLRPLAKGQHKLYLQFTGVHNDKLVGWYRSKYVVEGKEKYLVTSHFEPADARRAFPCVDHPSYKATFDIEMVVDKNLVALSNTLPIQEEIIGDKKKILFATTPLMSTYLVYLGAGEFEFLETKYNTVIVRVVTTPGKKEYGKFALTCAKKFLKYFEDYFNYSYPLKKLDFIATPDFAMGAMENWGAITFRENALLYYPQKSSRATMQRIAEIIAHELAHQWFGNLVTMKWWEDLWLNESFATYMAYKTMDIYWPEWNVWADFVSYSSFSGMALDRLHSSHPIKVKVEHTKDVDELFDEIAYEKGGSILRMLDHYVGFKDFRKGLRSYIKKYQYANAEAHDLWNSIEKASHKPTLKIMEDFITKTGFPVIHAKTSGNKLQLIQKRFLLTGTPANNYWQVPMNIQTSEKSKLNILLKEKTKDILIDKKPKFININNDYSGFFISNYSKQLLVYLGKERASLNEREIIGLIHDLFSQVLADKFEFVDFLNFIETYFIAETNPEVLMYLVGKLFGIYILLPYKSLKKILLSLAHSSLMITTLVPFANETIHITSLRNSTLSCLAFFDDKIVKRQLLQNLTNYSKDHSSLHSDLYAVTFNSATWFDDANYQVILNLYNKAQSEEERIKLLAALANVKNEKLIKKTLNFLFTGEARLANILYILMTAARNPYGKTITLRWLLDNWEPFRKKTGEYAKSLLRRSLKIVVPIGAIGSEIEVAKFLKKNKVPGLSKTYKQVLEELEINSRFVKKNKK